MQKHTIVLVALALLGTAGVGVAQDPKLPDGLRHVPGDAMGFIHIRASDFIKSPAGIALLSELQQDREAKKGLQELETKLGIKATELESVTVLMLTPPPIGMNKRWDGPRFKPSPRDFEMPRAVPIPPPPAKEDKNDARKDSPVVFQDVQFLPAQGGPLHRHFDEFDRDFDDDFYLATRPLVIVTSTKALDRKKILKAQLFGAQ